MDMKQTKQLPDSYFDDQEFLVDGIDEDIILGVLGKNPSPDQLLKFELCSYIGNYINSQRLSLSKVQELTGINSSDISRIKNHHLERFTIGKLIKIYTLLDTQHGIGAVLSIAGEKISRISARVGA
jgi:predicted XRE-type DNA-binding protein